MATRRTWRLGHKDRDNPAEPPEEVGKADEECLGQLDESEVEQRADADGLANRWRESHERWRRELRSSHG